MAHPTWADVGRRVRLVYPDGKQSEERVASISTLGAVKISSGHKFLAMHLSPKGDMYERNVLGKAGAIIQLFPADTP